jgi:hypothetical protein
MEKKQELYKRFEELAKERYPITVKEFYNSTMNLMDMAYNLDRESPLVTADVDEAAKEFQKSNPLAKTLLTDYFIAGVQWQKQQMAVTGTAEEILSSFYWKQYPASWANFTERQRATLVKCMEVYASAQSTTIERLTNALEYAQNKIYILEHTKNGVADHIRVDLMKLRDCVDEALNSIKK